MIVRTPWPSSPTSQRHGARVLDLGRGVGAVAELVLQALEVDRVARRPAASAAPGSSRARPRSGQASGTRPTSAPSRTTCGRPARQAPRRPARRAWCWRARPSHPASRSSPCRSGRRAWPRPARRRGRTRRTGSSAATSAASAGASRSAGTRGEGHRDRAAHAALDLIEQERRGGPSDVGAGPAARPRAGRGPARRSRGPAGRARRGELDLVDPLAEPVVAAQFRRVAVGLLAEPRSLGRAEPGAEAREPRLGPQPRALPRGTPRRAPGPARTDCALERRRLVLDLMGRKARCGHGPSPERAVAPQGPAQGPEADPDGASWTAGPQR